MLISLGHLGSMTKRNRRVSRVQEGRTRYDLHKLPGVDDKTERGVAGARRAAHKTISLGHMGSMTKGNGG